MQWNAALEDHQILGVMSDEGRGLLRGCYWGEYTRHGVLDIDPGSRYQKPEALTKLLQEFSLQGLRLVPYRSSERGGWHLYMYFDRDVLSQEVEATIKNYLRARGYEIKGGTLEVFPSGNALRLPLQPGFAWLAPDGKIEVKREELTQEQALALFFNDLHENRSNWSEAKDRIEREIRSAGSAGDSRAQEHRNAVTVDGLERLFQKSIDCEKWQRGRSYWQIGLTDKSQRHDAIICVGHYLWYGDEAAGVKALPGRRNQEMRRQLIKECLQEKHNGHSEDINKGRWSEIEGDIERAVSWSRQTPVIQEYEPYQLTERLLKRLKWLYERTGRLFTIEELAKANIDRSLNARHRIAMAVAQLEAENQEIDISKVARRAKACHKTVAKNRDLLCSPGGEYIAGGEGGLSGSSLPAAGSETEEKISVLVQGGVELGCAVSDGGIAGARDFDAPGLEDSVSRPVSEDFCALEGCSCLELGGVGTEDSAVAPLFHGRQESQPESPQSQAQALRVPTASLTLGPRLSGIQPLGHVTTGEILLFSRTGSVWYADATICGIDGRAGANSRGCLQSSFGAAGGESNTVLDAINYRFLTTGKSGYSSQKKDKFSLIDSRTNVINFPVSVPLRSFEAVAHMTILLIEQGVDSLLVTILLFGANEKVEKGHDWLRCRQLLCDHMGEYGVNLERGPPTCKQPTSWQSC